MDDSFPFGDYKATWFWPSPHDFIYWGQRYEPIEEEV